MYLGKTAPTAHRLGLVDQAAPVAPAPPLGTFGRVQYEIAQILGAEAGRWSIPGSLLSNGNYRLQIEHPGSGINNRFRRYSFQDNDKCNLFALDVAWRSGFRVPILNIGNQAHPRYSYPLANTLTSYAEHAIRHGSPRLRGVGGDAWGAPQTGTPLAVINLAIRYLGALAIVVGWRRSGMGHVGIIHKIGGLTYDSSRHITSITYDGWEATGVHGASNVIGRNWRTTNNCGPVTGVHQANPPGPLLHVFCRIHIISLIPERIRANRASLTRIVSRYRL
jgi:hypothetical protein